MESAAAGRLCSLPLFFSELGKKELAFHLKIGYHNKAVSKKKRGSGEIGRRARFRGVWVKPCGFKSHLPHHRMRKPRNEVFLLVQRKQAESRYDQAPGLTDLFVLGNPDGLPFFLFSLQRRGFCISELSDVFSRNDTTNTTDCLFWEKPGLSFAAEGV